MTQKKKTDDLIEPAASKEETPAVKKRRGRPPKAAAATEEKTEKPAKKADEPKAPKKVTRTRKKPVASPEAETPELLALPVAPAPEKNGAEAPKVAENIEAPKPEEAAPAEGGDSQERSYSSRSRNWRHNKKGWRKRDGRGRQAEMELSGSEAANSSGGDRPAREENVPVASSQPPVYAEGIVEVSGKGFGFLRESKRNYTQSNADVFVTPEVVRKHALRDGMWIRGETRRGSRGIQLYKLTEIEGESPERFTNLPVFEELTTINPNQRVRLETAPERHTTRVIDLMTPVGKGQRGLIVAPPRTGKTTLLQHIAEAVAKNYPDMKLIVLLVDERPEEVTEMRRTLPTAELMASSNDSDIKSHTRIAQLAIERAKRLVEMGKDVFVLMDSLTRVGRAFNNAQGGGGRTMSGGVDSRALEIPRKLFAAARNTEEAGSLTIMATALIETGSRMDDLIFQEFKGTGNMELVLARIISEQRIYPAVDIFQSGTRREELLLGEEEMHKINVIRRGLAGHKPLEAIERLLFFIRKYPTNVEMLRNIPG